MKHLNEYISSNEDKQELSDYILFEMASFTKEDMVKMFGKATIKVAKFINYFEKFLLSIKKEYSITNKQDVDFLYTKLMNALNGSGYTKSDLEEFHCNTPENLKQILGDNIDLINKILQKDYIKTNLSKLKKEYNEYKSNNDEYVPLEDYDKDNEYADDEELGRAWCIYYSWDPSDTSLVKVFRLKGNNSNKNKDFKHKINMCKMDWNEQTKLGYYHANPCLVEYYRKSGKEELMNDYIGEYD